MRRLLLVAGLAALVIGAWWLADDGRLRQKIAAIGSDVLDRARGGPSPSWGDVAERVGEFAVEERGLRETIGSLGAAEEEPDGAEAGPEVEPPG